MKRYLEIIQAAEMVLDLTEASKPKFPKGTWFRLNRLRGKPRRSKAFRGFSESPEASQNRCNGKSYCQVES